MPIYLSIYLSIYQKPTLGITSILMYIYIYMLVLSKHQLYGHFPPIMKTIQVRRTRHAGHCWRSRDELISDVLPWTPSYGRKKVGQPARTYIQQLCEDTGCSPEDQPEAMNDREKWRESVRDIRAGGTSWWWWWWYIYIVLSDGNSNLVWVSIQLHYIRSECEFYYIPTKEFGINNSHTSSTHIDLYDIPHIFYKRIIHTLCLRTLTG